MRGFFLACCVVLSLTKASRADVFHMPAGLTSIETVHVGNPGNAGEPSGTGAGGYGPDRVCGAVGYTYSIGKYEVTAGQYCDFLNAVAKTDTYGLYNLRMTTSYGCNIHQTGTAGDYSYTVAADWANRPVNFVTWGDAARFCNWLTNGQPTGGQDVSTTEDGSYYLKGANDDASLMAVMRKANARYVIPTEDEWYKAAYHKNDGVTGNYFDYPTSSDIAPSNVLSTPTNTATYRPYGADHTIGSPYYRTEVGAHATSASSYGTFDQGGNVHEWNETSDHQGASYIRVLRGGDFGSSENLLASTRGSGTIPTNDDKYFGFRIAYIPEPGTLGLLALGCLFLLLRSAAKRSP